MVILHGAETIGKYEGMAETRFMTTFIARIKSWAARIKRDAVTLWFASKHPATPCGAKALGVFVVGYALSPIDLIPDFIPVVGYLDDLLLLPALIWLAVRMIPEPVLAECRIQADDWMEKEGKKPVSRIGAVVIVGVWIALGVAGWVWWSRQG
jgi:uncharacterized membrane protein YkvA (DUF1232 family)